ncbi:MAG: glycoside hydrolase family 25 protein [Lachnospiraceae bacterium]|nr:glycoside hydrolase family 25 protein [Lachnospiraceae bacterium]
MDSRLKNQAVAVAVIMVLLIVTVMVVTNMTQKKNNNKDAAKDQEQEQMPVIEAEEGEYGLDPKKDPYAFLQDEDFFEPEKEYAQPEITLSLLVSSVEKDMRVNVVNGRGELVADHPFSVKVTDANGKVRNYKDADQDGSIYIAPVEPGEYQVSLVETEGFLLAEEQVPVSVKEQLDYTVIDDISFLIKSVDEINEAEEDTAINAAELEADGTEINRPLEQDALFGIDVSKHNNKIDWESVKAAGVDFVIIRCGYRGSKSGYLVEDPRFQENIEGAEAAGLKVGIYFFTQATTEVEAVEEASMVLTLCRDYKLALPIFIDTEGAGGNGRADRLDKETRTKVCRAFCQTIDNNGFHAGVYASKSWFENNLDATQFDNYYIWLAQYSRQATYGRHYDLWQYTSSGTVDGITTRVDLDMCYTNF